MSIVGFSIVLIMCIIWFPLVRWLVAWSITLGVLFLVGPIWAAFVGLCFIAIADPMTWA